MDARAGPRLSVCDLRETSAVFGGKKKIRPVAELPLTTNSKLSIVSILILWKLCRRLHTTENLYKCRPGFLIYF